MFQEDALLHSRNSSKAVGALLLFSTFVLVMTGMLEASAKDLFQTETPKLDGAAEKLETPTPLRGSTSYSELSQYGIEVSGTDKNGKHLEVISAVRPASRAAGWGVEPRKGVGVSSFSAAPSSLGVSV